MDGLTTFRWPVYDFSAKSRYQGGEFRSKDFTLNGSNVKLHLKFAAPGSFYSDHPAAWLCLSDLAGETEVPVSYTLWAENNLGAQVGGYTENRKFFLFPLALINLGLQTSSSNRTMSPAMITSSLEIFFARRTATSPMPTWSTFVVKYATNNSRRLKSRRNPRKPSNAKNPSTYKSMTPTITNKPNHNTRRSTHQKRPKSSHETSHEKSHRNVSKSKRPATCHRSVRSERRKTYSLEENCGTSTNKVTPVTAPFRLETRPLR